MSKQKKEKVELYVQPLVEISENKTVRIPKQWLDRWEKWKGSPCTAMVMLFRGDTLAMGPIFGEYFNDSLRQSAPSEWITDNPSVNYEIITYQLK